MSTYTIQAEPIPRYCPQCGTEFVYIEHPLWPGVPMMAQCACKVRVTAHEGSTNVTMTFEPPSKTEG